MAFCSFSTFQSSIQRGKSLAPSPPTVVIPNVLDSSSMYVYFTAPNETINYYTATSSPGYLTGTGSTSPITVNGLSGNTAYTFTVTATSSLGTSVPSIASSSVLTTPNPPTSLVGTVVDVSSISLAFTASSGAGTITGYTAKSNPVGVTVGFSVSNPSYFLVNVSTNTKINLIDGQLGVNYKLLVQGINGTMYNYLINNTPGVVGVWLNAYDASTNASGYGFVNVTLSSVNYAQLEYPFQLSSSSTINFFMYGLGIGVDTNTPYLPSTQYAQIVIPNTNNLTITKTFTTSPVTVTGLLGNSAYTFTVTATNSSGTSVASSSSSSALTTPNAPTIGTATVLDISSVSVVFTAPSGASGAITGYTVTSTPSGGTGGTGTASPIKVFGLSSNTNYTFKVTATNSSGTSVLSSASAQVTTKPGPPTIDASSIILLDTSAVNVSVTAPSGTGSISSYTVTSTPGGLTGTSTSSVVTVSGLTSSTIYTFTATATNSSGTSVSSSASASITLFNTSFVPITNPEFSVPAVPVNTYISLPYNTTSLTGWNLTGTSSLTNVFVAKGITTFSGTAPPPSPAGQYIATQLGANGTETISQVINIASIGTYTVKFYARKRSGTYNPSLVTVSLNGTSLSFTPSTWILYSFTTTVATVGSYTLSIEASGNQDTFMCITEVVITSPAYTFRVKSSTSVVPTTVNGYTLSNTSVAMVNDATRGFVFSFGTNKSLSINLATPINSTKTFWLSSSTPGNSDGNVYSTAKMPIWFNSTTSLKATVNFGGSPVANVVSTIAQTITWKFYAITTTATTTTMYVNGNVVASANVSWTGDTGAMYFGSFTTGVNNYAGSMDDIIFYSFILTPAEIQTLYTITLL